MAETESRVETCRRGHHWTVCDSLTIRPGDPDPVCPVCGEPAGPSPPPREVGQSTRILPPTRDPWEETPGAQAATTSEPAIPGYAILGVIGRGSAGVVYKARDVLNDRLVALKVIPADGLGTSEERPRFRVGAASVRLRHPNIVPVLAADRQVDSFYVASEFTEGKTLAEVVAGEPLAVFAAAHLAEILARAVRAAEQQGFVHGNLKTREHPARDGPGRPVHRPRARSPDR
jgi:serine/threonine protein kinase